MDWSEFHAEREKTGRPFVIAHRGTPKREPENTLRAFAHALGLGADVLETDLRFTRDGEIVLIHDETVDRTTDGTGLVRDYLLRDLKRLRTRRPSDDRPVDEPIPTLVELLALTQGGTPLLLELKDNRFAGQRYAQQLVDTLAAYDMLQRVAIISFQQELVRGVKLACPQIAAGYVTLNDPRPPRDADLAGPFWPLLLLNPFYVHDVHQRNGIIAPLDPNPRPRLALYMKLGVDALLADEPSEVLDALEQRTA
jgi:glycerophosphoryl diester phosphodiesterase